MDIKDAYNTLKDSEIFRQWNSDGYILSSAISQLADGQTLIWDFNYINPADKTMEGFSVGETVERKPQDKPLDPRVTAQSVDPASVLSAEHTLKLVQEALSQQVNKGFIMLTKDEVVAWNVVCVAENLQLMNVKINAETGQVLSQETVRLAEMQRKPNGEQ